MTGSDRNKPKWVDEVLDFWFSESTAEDWFRKDDALDDLMRRRFLALHQALMQEPVMADGTNPRVILAKIIVFDQFSRNMFRGTPRAFASDTLALTLARSAVNHGLDRDMTKDERLFLYLPFEHNENIDDQRLSVALIEKLGDAELTHYAVAHRDIINRFGRFPHRNAILGRVSTGEEVEFLTQPGSSF